MQEHVELEVSLEIIMARIAQAIFNLNKGKSQAYDYVKKMQSYAKELYNKNYR